MAIQYRAMLKQVRITPRKLGVLADTVRGKMLMDALGILKLSPRRKTADVLAKVIWSAASNAAQTQRIDVNNLFVDTILVGPGATLKRFLPRAKGSASRILKRTSHITVLVKEV